MRRSDPDLKKFEKNNKKGFTLIELLLVIGIIAVLAVTVFVALDPAKRFRDARDARRYSDAQALYSAVNQYIIDNKGALPTGLEAGIEKQIGTEMTSCAILGQGGCNTENADCIDLTPDLSRYLRTLPVDPSYGTSFHTFYTVELDAGGTIVSVRACGAEGDSEIVVPQ